MKKSKYSIKEIYYTLQGEGFHTGQAAVFCRFTGCNLWSGREEDRENAICKFCDTDFLGIDGLNGGRYTAVLLAEKILEIWPLESKAFIVFTGGEPALQLNEELINEMVGQLEENLLVIEQVKKQLENTGDITNEKLKNTYFVGCANGLITAAGCCTSPTIESCPRSG